MTVRFSSLGSGSEGNALIVQVHDSLLMMDCGFGVAETEKRLARAGLSPENLDAIVVTHEHSDHIGGVARFARKYKIPVWLTHGTAKVLKEGSLSPSLLHFVDPHDAFTVGDIHVTPFFVPHDAYEPVQYVFSDGEVRLGVLTDTGTITEHIESTLSGCEALILECNHDLEMLMSGPYPASLKKRVASYTRPNSTCPTYKQEVCRYWSSQSARAWVAARVKTHHWRPRCTPRAWRNKT